MKVFVRVLAIAWVLVIASARAQTPEVPQPPPPAPPPVAQTAPTNVSPTQARYNISVLEAVFETAVQRGAQMLREEVQGIMSPDMILLAGQPRARGFRLEGYGVFFDVDVPAINQTIAWTTWKMNQNDALARNALQQLRTMARTATDRRQREDLDWFLRQISVQLGIPDTATATTTATPGGMPPPGVAVATEAPPPAAGQVAGARPTFLDDPVGAYESAVKKALIDAMLDYSGPLDIAADEWLTVAARDNGDRLSPATPYEVATILMRLKGSDLLAFRAGRLTRDEAHKRVEVREF